MVRNVESGIAGDRHAGPTSRGSVLIVDDEDGVRAMLVDLLSNEGFECLEAPDGEQALELLEKNAPALGVLDVSLPGISGAELAWRIRERLPDMPLIALSGQLEMWEQDDLRDLGFARVFAKPMNCEDFLRVCREASGSPGAAGGSDQATC
jgi:CheY-like chemotaxis protein